MVYVRKSVWANGGGFDDPLLYWYAIGVSALQKRGLNDNTSWRFMAAIHGIDITSSDGSLWQQYGYYTPGEPLPSQADQDLYWNQCQHGSWYFLPWHRGYIWSIEGLVRAEIIKAGGPKDWAMPYWNYSDQKNPQALLLPPAFSATTMPDGSANPLYVAQRYGLGSTPIVLPASDVTLGALSATQFVGLKVGASAGLGGGKTGFSHNGIQTGELESKPHNIVHVDIGGQNDAGPGLMADPDIAGLDPIFWLHHANIDRLWDVWNKSSATHTNPTDPAWLNGPQDRKFVVPNVDGSPYSYAPKDMVDTTSPNLNYTYDEFVVATAVSSVLTSNVGEKTLSQSQEPELVGANASVVNVTGKMSSSNLALDAQTSALLSVNPTQNLQAKLAQPARDRYFLNLENIKAAKDGFVIDVYMELPEGADHTGRMDLFCGSIGLFGVRKASQPDGAHGGAGVTEVMDVTNVVAGLAQNGALNKGEFSVNLVPRITLTDDAKVTVERISLYKQSA
ncbi:tyrosinase [Agrobacterium vitis]|nr:tyrosinase [Agrobacterium vitis]